MAGPLLEKASAAGNAAAEYAAIQNSLWSGDPAGVLDVAESSGYASYLEPLSALVKELELSQTPTSGIFTDATLTEVREVFASLERLKGSLALHTEAIDNTLSVLRGVARNRLERAIYEYRQDTYLLRFELGDYYLLEGDYAESKEQARSSYSAAALQLKLVLDIDPFNTGAVYKLGILYDRLGNWSRAMESYADVYEADPRFENVAAYYNQLARGHADKADFDLQLTVDASRIEQKSSLSLGNEFDSVVGLRSYTASETVRMFRALEDEGAPEPWQYQVHELKFFVPLTVPGTGLTLTPVAGIKVSSELLNDGVAVLSEALNPIIVIGSYDVEPVVGGDLYLATDHLSLSGSYRYGRFDESYQPGAQRLVSHSAAASAKLNFSVFNQALLRYSSASVGGDLDLLTDGSGSSVQVNTLYGGNQRLEIVFHVADSPWTNFTLFQTLNYRSSEIPGATEYFAPNNMLQINAGAGMATWLNVNSTTTLGLILNISSGILMPGSSGEETAAIQTQAGADLRAELTVEDVTYYLAASVSGSAEKVPGLNYWSSSVNLGVSARLPRLLAD